jgi:Raf kinase inhibitor-like YbhB/YbcL family protein
MYRRLLLLALASAAAVSVVIAGSAGAAGTFSLTSTAFSDGQPIPSAYTCDGKNNPPPLAWSNAPADTRSYAILADDTTEITIPEGPPPFVLHFTHWITWNIDGGATSVDTGRSHRVFGTNQFGRHDYNGPCAPADPANPFSGPHTYVFTLYALTAPLNLKLGATRDQFDTAVADVDAGHITTLTGTYCRGC